MTQLNSIAIVDGLVYAIGFVEHNLATSVSIVAALGILATTLSILIYTFVSRPLKDILAAVIHVSGEPTSTPPPNPNDSRFEKSGFKDILQTIYQLASSDDKGVTTNNSSSSDVVSALNQTLCGFIVMSRDGVISFSNTAAPVNVDTNGNDAPH